MAALAAHGNPDTLGQRIRRLRLANGLTQGQLASRMRVTQARVSQIEAGTDSRQLPFRTLCDLADGLGVDFKELVAGDPTYEHVDLDDSSILTPNVTTLHAIAPLFDRTVELATILAVLRKEEARLLTIVGPAGVGKTQLALHAAAALRVDYPDQVTISLATCRDVAKCGFSISSPAGNKSSTTSWSSAPGAPP